MAQGMLREERPEHHLKIHLLDPHTYSMVFGWYLCEMARKLKNGAEISHVIREFEKQMDCMEIVLGPYSLKQMKKSGRISAAAAVMGELMGIRPIITLIDGKTKVDGKRASGNGFSTYTDQDKNRFYVSPQVLAAILGKTYTDLGDGVFSFTGVTLDGFDSQKAYLKNMKDKLGDAVDGDIPEADVYIALTFDDGPTGKKDGYPNGLTNYLLDGLKQRGAVATF